jgi:hypothetical protein
LAFHPGRAATRAASEEGLGSGHAPPIKPQESPLGTCGRADLPHRKELLVLLRHADGGTLAHHVYSHQFPLAAPGVAGLIEDVFGRAARDARPMSSPRRAEGKRRETWPAQGT